MARISTEGEKQRTKKRREREKSKEEEKHVKSGGYNNIRYNNSG